MTKSPDFQANRRNLLKLGGGSLLALGLQYSKPTIQTVHASPAFENYGSDDWKEKKEKKDKDGRKDK